MTFTDEQLRAYAEHRCRPSQCRRHMEEEHEHQRRLATELLDARKALEVVPHILDDGYNVALSRTDKHADHAADTCAANGGACNARRILGE